MNMIPFRLATLIFALVFLAAAAIFLGSLLTGPLLSSLSETSGFLA